MFQGTSGERISKYTAWAIFLLACFLLVQVITGLKRMSYIGKEIYPQRTIMVMGEGEAFAVPDIGSFSFSVTESGATVKEAQEKADTKINKALSSVREAGVEDKDIKTTGYNVYPRYEWEQIYCITTPCPGGKNVLNGYEVSQTITVKVRDTEKAGDLVTKVGAVGVSNISGLDFTVDDREKYVAMAREQAIEKAKENAKKLAKDLDVRLGKMLYFNDNSGYPTPYYGEGMGGDMVRSSAAPMKAEIPVGESKITSQVSLTYEIK
ncbi:MAG TPA: SIMPL domain-containing protein [Candidatus Paceibacterota bacterium]